MGVIESGRGVKICGKRQAVKMKVVGGKKVLGGIKMVGVKILKKSGRGKFLSPSTCLNGIALIVLKKFKKFMQKRFRPPRNRFL